jgi:hypothetical protein
MLPGWEKGGLPCRSEDHPGIKIGGTKRPKGAYPVPTGGYAIPVRKHHGSVYVESVANERPDTRLLARALVDWAKQVLERQKLTAAALPDEPEPTSSDQRPTPSRSR